MTPNCPFCADTGKTIYGDPCSHPNYIIDSGGYIRKRTLKMVVYGKPAYGRSYAYPWQLERDWQWPEPWWGTLCTLPLRNQTSGVTR